MASRRYPSRISSKQAEHALANMLAPGRCTDECLMLFTPEGLHRSWNVPLGKIAQMLAAAKARRGL